MSVQISKVKAAVLEELEIPSRYCGTESLSLALWKPNHPTAGWDRQRWWKKMALVHGRSIFAIAEHGGIHATALKKQVEVGLCFSSDIFDSLPSRLSGPVAEGENLPPLSRVVLDATGEKEELLIDLGDRRVELQKTDPDSPKLGYVYDRHVKLAKQGAMWSLVGVFDLEQDTFGSPRPSSIRAINPPLTCAFSQFLNIQAVTEEILHGEIIAPAVRDTFSGLLPGGVTDIVLGYAGARSDREKEAAKKNTQALRDSLKEKG